MTSFNSILTSEMQRLYVTADDRIRLIKLIKEVEDILANYEKQNAENCCSPKQLLWERKLLDLSFRNNLLNMKTGKRVLPFLPCPIDEMEDSLFDGNEYELKKGLIDQDAVRILYRTARTMLEESGANCLFLALGTLKYDGHQAPLLLLPVDIVPVGRGNYVLRRREEETMFNFTLVEFLKQNYGLDLSPFSQSGDLPTDAHGVDVSLILHLTKTAIAGFKDWSVTEDANLGIFSFVKYIMWKDIHSHGQVLTTHPILKSLIEGRLLIDDIESPADARVFDRNAMPLNMALPLSYDSSQLEAVADAESGRSLVLYGPPGTGKSQTITNLIANALYHGKRVLFVAQKKAALDVVEKRLTDVGLGSFCLELHSNKANKQHFLSQMDTLVQMWINSEPDNSDKYRKSSDELHRRRLELADYVDSLQYKATNEDLSIQDCITQYAAIGGDVEIVQKESRPTLYSASVKQVIPLMSKSELDDVITNCLLLDADERILGMPINQFPLYGLHPKAGQRDLAKNLEQALSQLSQVADNAEKQAESIVNRNFMHKSAKEIFESDYRWKHFVQLAQPEPSLLEDFEAMKGYIGRWQSGIRLLEKWMKYLLPEEMLRQFGLDEAIVYHNKGYSGKAISEAIKKGWLRKVAEQKIKENPILCGFNGILFEQVIEQYRNLADEYQDLTREMVAKKLIENLTECSADAEFSSEMTLLRKRIANRGRGTTIRGMLEQMPHILPVMAPCMLMSPLSVAQFLNMETPPFDIVVFDEASQMPTGEAVGSIARGKSVVVVGDPKQMPPTSFFETSVSDDEEMEAEDLDSILDDCISLSMPARYLSWHYRSQHESLISFSNTHYYEGRLFTFPSADSNVSHVTWQHVDGYYDYGKTRTNRAEAEAIVAEIEQRLLKGCKDSIGIIAFSKQQSDLIEDILNEHLYAKAELNEMANQLCDSLFVKNLENVQGDERDVILFSVGYGPDKDGKVSMNFGPLNQDGGERRLNVAVSRARKEMKVFSTLRPEQIDERKTRAKGVIGLKHFLEFASCTMSVSEDVSTTVRNGVIKEVASKLKCMGYRVVTNIGMSNMKIDLAIADADKDDTFCLGVIFDGENYQRLKTMRDREIVLPTMLHSLGWNIMHLWSLEWFVSPDLVVKEIVKKLRNILTCAS